MSGTYYNMQSSICTCQHPHTLHRHYQLSRLPNNDAWKKEQHTEAVSPILILPHFSTKYKSHYFRILKFEEMKKEKEKPKGVAPKKSLADLP